MPRARTPPQRRSRRRADPLDGAARALREGLLEASRRFPARPRRVPDLSTYTMPDGLGVQFRGVGPPVLLRGENVEAAFAFLNAALDGTRTVDRLLAERPRDLPAETVLRVLSLLHDKGLLTGEGPAVPDDAADSALARQRLFFGRNAALFERAGGGAQDRLSAARVVVLASGVFGAATCDLLTRSGCTKVSALAWDDDGLLADGLAVAPVPLREVVRLEAASVEEAAAAVRARIAGADLVLTATRNAPAALFRAVNRICLEARVPWLRANEAQGELEIGPLVLPHASACTTCMELRQASTHPRAIEEQLYERHLAADRPAGATAPRGELLAAATLGASALALEAVRVLSGITASPLLGAVRSFSAVDGSVRTNRFLRVPRCPDCYPGPIEPARTSGG